MSRSSEEVLLVVKHVKNKKTEGTLYMMGERMAWMVASRNTFSLSYNFADIRIQKISPDTKDKVQLQIVLHDGTANTFHFNNPGGREEAKKDREGVKELLQSLLPKFRTKVNSELEAKNRMLQEDPELFQLYKDLVVSGVITAEEFWANRTKNNGPMKNQTRQDVGVSAAFLADIKPQTDGCNGLKYNLTTDIIESIFRTYPAVKKKHAENVPDKLSEADFWTRFFQSHYFHRDRINLDNKDLFSDCAKSDDQAIATDSLQPIKDPFLDLTRLSDDSKAEGYGTSRDHLSSASAGINHLNASLIKRFNQHSTMVLKACDLKVNRAFSLDNTAAAASASTMANGAAAAASTSAVSTPINGVMANGTSMTPTLCSDAGPSPVKRAKLKEKTEFEDLGSASTSSSSSSSTPLPAGPALRLCHMDRYLHGPTPVTATQYNTSADILVACQAVTQEMMAWNPQLNQALSANVAVSVLGELTPGGALMQGHSQQQLHQLVPTEIQHEVRQLYNALCELLRHFWSCFPVTSKELEEKLLRMRSNLERFQNAKLQPLQQRLYSQSYTMHLTSHLEQMLQAAFTKFNVWHAKRMSKGKS